MTQKHLERELVHDTPRPFRIYNANHKRFLLYYNFKHKLGAMRAAYWIVRWVAINTTLEVIDVRTMRLHAAYTSKPDGLVHCYSETSVKHGLHIKHTNQ